MAILFSNRWLYISIALFVIALVFAMMASIGSKNEVELVTVAAETGPVRQLVSVSGIAESNQSAELAFPVTGIVRAVNVRTGDEVRKGDVLASLDTSALYADRQEAMAGLTSVIATRNELLTGPTDTTRSVTSETMTAKEIALETTRKNEAEKVANAYRTLLSSGLTAYSEDQDEDASTPTVSGTYNCQEQGSYRLEVFASDTNSGFSYRLSGLESGTFGATDNHPSPLGTCGLQIQFVSGDPYNRSVWIVEIPNTRAATYISNQNAYDLAVTQADNAIKTAEQALVLAKADAENQNAPARSEAVERANASIAQARARLSRIDASIADRVLAAPFDGTITDIDILPGETVTTVPIISLLAEADFEVTARIPEIDIGKLLVGQRAELLFDAKSDEIITGIVRFISLQATEIDGVAYYEAFITLDTVPAWMRSGLNADIEIIIEEASDTIRIPRRFLNKTASGYTVLTLGPNDSVASTSVELILEGNDGYIAITGINEGDIVVAP